MTIWAIVPVKPLRYGKSRLSGILSEDQRTQLNRRLLEHFRPPPLPPELPVRSLASDDDPNLLLGYVLEGRADTAGALTAFRRVQGGAAARAGREIERLTSPPPGARR